MGRRHRNILRLLTAALLVGVPVAVARDTPLRRWLVPQPREVLDRRIAALTLVDVPFADAIDQLHRLSGVDIDVDWADVRTVSFEEQAVDVQLRDVTLDQALDCVLQAGYPNRLKFCVDGRTVRIGTGDRMDKMRVVRMVDLSDLLSEDDAANRDGLERMTWESRLEVVNVAVRSYGGELWYGNTQAASSQNAAVGCFAGRVFYVAPQSVQTKIPTIIRAMCPIRRSPPASAAAQKDR